jgi:hypothetical protein
MSVFFGLFGLLSFFAAFAAPHLLIAAIKKVNNNESAYWECMWLSAGLICFCFWVFFGFLSLPAP